MSITFVFSLGNTSHAAITVMLPDIPCNKMQILNVDCFITQLNSGQYGDEYKGNDLKVEKAWLQGLSGCNVTVTVVDDGILEINVRNKTASI